MNEEQAEQLAWRILAEVEETIGWEGVTVNAGDPGNHMKVPAFFEDAEYEALEKTIIGILLEATAVQPVLHAQSMDGHDW
jgi:hypothetical protein